MNKVKSKLRKGIEELDEGIRRLRSQYLTGDLSLREYLNQRGALEVEKVKRVLENLRSLHKGG